MHRSRVDDLSYALTLHEALIKKSQVDSKGDAIESVSQMIDTKLNA